MSDYKIFTTAHDTVVHARELLADIPDDLTRNLDDFLDRMTPEVIDGVDETGVEDATFCHSGLFFAAGDSRECLRELACMAMPEEPTPGL